MPGTITPVAFGGRPHAVVAPGTELVSDPVPVVAEAGRPIAVSLALAGAPDVVAEHPVALQTSYLSEAGYRALADAVDVTRLSGSPCLADRSSTRVALSGG